MIRLASKKELTVCSDLICQVISDVESRHYAPEIIEGWKKYNSPTNLQKESLKTKFLVCEENNKIIGVGAIEGSHIKKVYVLPLYQGKGIGRRIMNTLEQVGKDHGCKAFELNSTINAIVFYKKLGYKEEGPITVKRGGISVTYTRMKKY